MGIRSRPLHQDSIDVCRGAGNKRNLVASGDQIIYWLDDADGSSLMRKAADGTGEPTTLVTAEDHLHQPHWSRDGRFLVYAQETLENGFDIRYLELGADGSFGEPVSFLSTPDQERATRVSPDGRLIAYQSDESGRREVYVRPFPSGDGKWQASVDGGDDPRWSRDGSELYYVSSGAFVSVAVSTGRGFALGPPQDLFQFDEQGAPDATFRYDVSGDGQRFMTTTSVEQDDDFPRFIRVVQNWYEEFRDREQD